MSLELVKFNIQDFLKTEEDLRGYVEAMAALAIEDGNDPVEYIKIALKGVAKARKISQVALAEKTKISRFTINKFFKKDSKPRADTLFAIAHALGVSIVPVPSR